MDNPGFLFSLVYIINFDMDVSYKFSSILWRRGETFQIPGGGGFKI